MFERWIEKSLFASRWILAPIYLGLTIAMLAVGIKFFQEAFHVLLHVWTMDESDMVLAVLAMIDMVLVASLVVMVMLSGYENFVSQIELADEGKKTRLAGQTGCDGPQTQGVGLYRGHLLHPSATDLHECSADSER